jgi:hypothetical protein
VIVTDEQMRERAELALALARQTLTPKAPDYAVRNNLAVIVLILAEGREVPGLKPDPVPGPIRVTELPRYRANRLSVLRPRWERARDRIMVQAATWCLLLASRQTRARMRLGMELGAGRLPSEALMARAHVDRMTRPYGLREE